MFIPSGGGQWAVQGPVMIEAAEILGVNPSHVVLGVAYGDLMDKHDTTLLDNTTSCHCRLTYASNNGLHICNIHFYRFYIWRHNIYYVVIFISFKIFLSFCKL